jgi:FtsH-binding integral membrane protein
MNRFEPQRPWISASTAEMQLGERAFIRSVYRWMFGGLLVTALASLWVAMSPAMQETFLMNRTAPWILVMVELGLVFFLSARITQMSPGAAAGAFLVFSLVNGISLSAIFFVYTTGTIVSAFATAAGMFAAMSIYGTVTKRDLTSWGSFFFMGLIGIVLASVVNIFIHSSAISMAVAYLGVFIFVGLTAYDTQRLRVMATSAPPGLQENFAVIGALTLYLDFINLFMMLLRIFGGGRRR